MEQWKDIEGWEGLYAVSTYGNVKSYAKGDGNGYRDRILKQGNEVRGYKSVRFSRDGKTEKKMVHRLVAEAFIPNPENKPQVNHIDNDPSNNNVSNLEWVTGSENMIHAQRQGRLFEAQSKGGKVGGGKQRAAMLKKLGELGIDVLEVWTEDHSRKTIIRYITACRHAIQEGRADRVMAFPNCAKCNEISKYKKTIARYTEKIKTIEKELKDGKSY